uniref:Uncharacterized protein n=1 Tax=Setaria viridis TaxID=4556 RepID=A0A4U6UIN6_SETVI|nr:hypothetical protein SEVIR_5G196700v2 [Setaria viridis]
MTWKNAVASLRLASAVTLTCRTHRLYARHPSISVIISYAQASPPSPCLPAARGAPPVTAALLARGSEINPLRFRPPISSARAAPPPLSSPAWLREELHLCSALSCGKSRINRFFPLRPDVLLYVFLLQGWLPVTSAEHRCTAVCNSSPNELSRSAGLCLLAINAGADISRPATGKGVDLGSGDGYQWQT